MTFFIPGTPRPGGSKSAFPMKSGKIAMVDASGKAGKEWRKTAALIGQQAMADKDPYKQPLKVSFWFYMPRPKKHFRINAKGTFLRDNAPRMHAIRPDTTKLIRSVEDALTGIVWEDDALIVQQHASKQYAAEDQVGCRVEVTCL